MGIPVRGRLVLCLIVVLPVMAGCGLRQRLLGLLGKDDQPVAVRIGERKYTRADLNRFFESRLSEFRDGGEADRARSQLLDTFIEEQVFLSEAERLNIEPNAEALQAVVRGMSDGPAAPKDPGMEAALRDSLRIQQYLHDHLFRDVKIEDKECEDYYNSRLAEFVINDVVRVREILVADLSQAEIVRTRLAAGKNKNFADLARLHSLGAGAASGGLMGTFQRGDLPEEFEKAIFPLAPGTVSKPVKSKYGIHFFLVEEKIAAHQQKFYEVRDQIRERLQLERERGIISAEMARLTRDVSVEVFRDALGFEYTGNRFPVR